MLTKLIVVINSPYISQVIMLYILNLYSAIYQLYLNKTRKKTKQNTCSKDLSKGEKKTSAFR